MKNSLTFLCLLFVSICTIAQNNTLPKTETGTRVLLCHEWKLAKAVMGGQTIKPEPKSEFYLIFDNSGKVTMVQNGKHDDMKWLLAFKTKELMIYGEKKELLAMMGEKAVLADLDDKLLVLAYYEKNQFMGKMYFTKVR